jgi:hypothetical protein
MVAIIKVRCIALSSPGLPALAFAAAARQRAIRKNMQMNNTKGEAGNHDGLLSGR